MIALVMGQQLDLWRMFVYVGVGVEERDSLHIDMANFHCEVKE